MNYSEHFLDLEYISGDHHENLLIYDKISKKILKEIEFLDNYEVMTQTEFYEFLYSWFLMVEFYIEKGIYAIEETVEKGIVAGYSMLIDKNFKGYSAIKDELFDLYDRKNWGYRNTEEHRLMWDSPFAFKLIIAQKIKRIKGQILDNVGLDVNEPLKETISDFINYCMIYLIWCEKGYPTLRDIKIINKGG